MCVYVFEWNGGENATRLEICLCFANSLSFLLSPMFTLYFGDYFLDGP